MQKMSPLMKMTGVCAISAILMCSCSEHHAFKNLLTKKGKCTMKEDSFGKTRCGKEVTAYTLTNPNGMRMKVINYGGTIVSLEVPDRDGNIDDVVLGFDNMKDCIADNMYIGTIVGRYGNRINQGKFAIDGKEYQLAQNNDGHHLHGGDRGFNKKLWDVEPFETDKSVGLKLTYLSKDGEENYPGNLQCTVRYTLTRCNKLIIEYEAETDKPTIINLTHHDYFNLKGQGSGDILGHEVMINADHFTPVDDSLIPTGELREVKGTPMDFTTPTVIGARINQDDQQLKYGNGYDQCYVLNKDKPGEVSLAARVYEPTSGRVMEVSTNEPGLQFYTGNFLDGTQTGKDGKVYKYRYGFCMETEKYPDSPNKPEFPSPVLRPGEKYYHKAVFAFSTK